MAELSDLLDTLTFIELNELNPPLSLPCSLSCKVSILETNDLKDLLDLLMVKSVNYTYSLLAFRWPPF